MHVLQKWNKVGLWYDFLLLQELALHPSTSNWHPLELKTYWYVLRMDQHNQHEYEYEPMDILAIPKAVMVLLQVRGGIVDMDHNFSLFLQ